MKIEICGEILDEDSLKSLISTAIMLAYAESVIENTITVTVGEIYSESALSCGSYKAVRPYLEQLVSVTQTPLSSQ